jgi:spermidine synthase
LTIADGRNYLKRVPRRYDVIISEPSNPWISGLASLFSREFFELAKERLKSDGVMLQWIQGYGIFPADLQMVARTFRTSFPATSVWNSLASDFLLVGRTAARRVDLARVGATYATNASLREDLTRSGLGSPAALLADFLLGEEDVARYAQNAGLNSDDILPLEFSAPRSLYLETGGLNRRIMRAFRRAEFPPMAGEDVGRLVAPAARYEIGMAYQRKNLPAEAAEQFEKALEREPGHLPSRLELGRLQLRSNLPLRAIENFEAVLSRDPRNADAAFQLAVAYQTQQLSAQALRYASKAVSFQPRNPTYQAYLAVLLDGQKRYAQAVEHYLLARREAPGRVDVLAALAAAYVRQGDVSAAIVALTEALDHRPDSAALLEQIGKAYAGAGRYPEAVAALRRALKEEPRRASAYVALGLVYASSGRPREAIDALERGLALEPSQAAASQALRDLSRRVYGADDLATSR